MPFCVSVRYKRDGQSAGEIWNIVAFMVFVLTREGRG